MIAAVAWSVGALLLVLEDVSLARWRTDVPDNMRARRLHTQVVMLRRVTIAAIFAGLQPAFSDAVRIDDVVVVEGEWGRVEEMRVELRRVCEGSELGDGRVCVLQVTEAVGGSVRLRALVGAADAGALWDLRCGATRSASFVGPDAPAPSPHR